MKNWSRTCAGTLFLLFWGWIPAHAACHVTTTGLNFGAYDVFSAVPRDTTGTATVSCDENPPTDIIVSIGPSAGSGGFNPRQMRRAGGSDLLGYNLYTTASMSTVWGDGSAGTSVISLKNVNRNRPVTTIIYGRIPDGQNVSVGSYAETLTVTITP